MSHQFKRIFFAFKIQAPWLKNGSGKKLIKEELRHITLAFLGQTPLDLLQKFLNEKKDHFSFSAPIFGYFSKLLFLPPFKARVLAIQPVFLSHPEKIIDFQQQLETLLLENRFLANQPKPWLPHVSLVRSPFHYYSWKNSFEEFPFYAEKLCVYESLGNLQYKELQSFPIPCPFIVKKQEDGWTIHAYSTDESMLNLLLLLGVSLHFQIQEKFPSLPILSDETLETFIRYSSFFLPNKWVFSFEKKIHDTHIEKMLKMQTIS